MPVTKKITDLALANVAAGDDVPIAQGGFLKRAKAGQANGLAILDSAGMPLDSAGRKIVVADSNSSGSYIRFADGTQICYNTVILNNPAFSGGAYGGSSIIWAIWTYPAAFALTPTVTLTANTTNGSPDRGLFVYSANAQTATSAGTLVINAGNISGLTQVILNMTAIGRWY